MDNSAKCKRHCVRFILNVALQTATLVTTVLAVHELDRIHHRLKKMEKKRKLV